MDYQKYIQILHVFSKNKIHEESSEVQFIDNTIIISWK